uniref:PCNA-interacting partner n=1 Tax=Callorhinchus milii TaxID=7868 RepID=V9KL86_CALMI
MDCVQLKVLQLVKTFRKECYKLSESERTTVCGADSMLMVLQLAMAEINKESCGEFSIALSDVLVSWRHLLQEKLNLLSEGEEAPEGYVKVRKAYDAFLNRSNSVDLIDVYRICIELKPENGLREMLSVVQLFDFLSGSSETLDNSLISVPTSPSNGYPINSKLALMVKKLLCDYLNLLVNSKSDLALACVFNSPDRGLGRNAFTDLRHAAQSKQTSLFLAATSFIRSLELGGKSYAPSEGDPLKQHVKGLLEFVHFTDALQEILGETADSSIAGGRILTVIKTRLLKGHGCESPLYLAAEEATRELRMRINNIINCQREARDGAATGISPARPRVYAINHASAYGGRDTVKAFLALMDEEAANLPSRNKAELLHGAEHHNVLGLPCMLTLFRSPEQPSGSSPKPLRNRVQSRVREGKAIKVKHNLIKSQFSCTYKEDDVVTNNLQNYRSLSQAPTCVHPGPKRVPDIYCDSTSTEDECEPRTSAAHSPVSKECAVKKHGLGMKAGNTQHKQSVNLKGSRKVTKRKLTELNSLSECNDASEPRQKSGKTNDVKCIPLKGKIDMKMPMSSKRGKNAAKNKLIPGQGKLTHFFRM